MAVNSTPAPSLTPRPKVVAGVLAGAVVTIGVWLLSAFGHVTQPPEVIGAEVVLISAVVAYLVPDSIY